MLVTKNPRQMTMEENIRWLLDSHPELDARVFGTNGILFPEIREKLLFRAHVLIDGCLKDYSWLQIDDIILFGSAVTYEYQEFSDFDLLVKVSLKEDVSALSSQTSFAYFIKKIHSNFLNKVGRFKIGNRTVEVKPVFFIRDLPQYSVLRNEWIKRPRHKNMADINPQEIIDKAKSIIAELKFLTNEKFEHPNGKYSLRDINEMRRFYNRVLEYFFGSEADWLVYKLVNYTRELYFFRAFYSQQTAVTLSF